MSTSLSPRVLVVEDRPSDAELVIDELRQAGYTPDWQRVETEAEYLAHLDSSLDLVIADYTLPQFGALEALHLLQERRLNIPFIVVSGSIGEDLAISAMKQGASDYLLKDRLARLGEAVRQVLLQSQLRHEKRQAEEALRASEERFRALIERGSDIIVVVDATTTIRYITPAVERILGYTPEQMVGKSVLEFIDPDDMQRAEPTLNQLQEPGAAFVPMEIRVRHRDGSVRSVEFMGKNLLDVPGVEGIVVNFRDITERKHAEESLAQERNLLRTLIDALPHAVYVKDVQGRIVLDNIQNQLNLGVMTKPHETLGKTDFDFHPRELAQRFFDDEQKIIQSGQALIDHEEPDIDPQGNIGWHLTTKVPLRDSQGQMFGIVGISRDITERKRAEEALRHSEATEREQRVLAEALRDSATAVASSLVPDVVMRQILENLGRVVPNETANIALIEGDAARIAFWRGYDRAAEQLFGTMRYPLETANLRQMLTTQAPVLIADTSADAKWNTHPETAWVRSYAGAPILAHGQVIGFLNVDSATPGFLTRRHAEGLKAFADQAAIAIENAQLYDQLRQHTHQLEARVAERTAELYQAKERVEAILNNSSDGIALARPNGILQQTNPAFDRLFGYEPVEAVGRALIEVVESSHVAMFQAALASVRDQGQSVRIELTLRDRDNTWFSADLALSAIIGTDGHCSGIVCSVQDITERKRMESDLREALKKEKELNELRSGFVSVVSHEFRTPLTVIQTSRELLEHYADRLSSEKRLGHLRQIQRQVDIMIDLLNDVLDYSKAQSGKVQLEPQPLNVVAFCTEIFEPLQATDAGAHRFIFVNRSQIGQANLDDRLVRHILVNLLSNAVKYSPGGGEIRLELSSEENSLVFRIGDQGIGIPPMDMQHLFEPFHRAANAAKIQGTGLGMSIVKSNVEAHRGTISVDSQEGVGTTFTVRLPVSANSI